MSRLASISQDWYEDNRERFDAETTSIDIPKRTDHTHSFYRTSASDIRCRSCTAGWLDPQGTLWKEIKKTISQ